MCQWGANMNSRAGIRMSPCPTANSPNRGVANRRPQFGIVDAGLSSGLITIVVMTLYTVLQKNSHNFLQSADIKTLNILPPQKVNIYLAWKQKEQKFQKLSNCVRLAQRQFQKSTSMQALIPTDAPFKVSRVQELQRLRFIHYK